MLSVSVLTNQDRPISTLGLIEPLLKNKQMFYEKLKDNEFIQVFSDLLSTIMRMAINESDKIYYTNLENDKGKDDDNEEQKGMLPKLKVGEDLGLSEAVASEQFSRPPARYAEASLVKKMEELGIGRPSTYAATITTIQKRGYIEKKNTTSGCATILPQFNHRLCGLRLGACCLVHGA